MDREEARDLSRAFYENKLQEMLSQIKAKASLGEYQVTVPWEDSKLVAGALNEIGHLGYSISINAYKKTVNIDWK